MTGYCRSSENKAKGVLLTAGVLTGATWVQVWSQGSADSGRYSDDHLPDCDCCYPGHQDGQGNRPHARPRWKGCPGLHLPFRCRSALCHISVAVFGWTLYVTLFPCTWFASSCMLLCCLDCVSHLLSFLTAVLMQQQADTLQPL